MYLGVPGAILDSSKQHWGAWFYFHWQRSVQKVVLDCLLSGQHEQISLKDTFYSAESWYCISAELVYPTQRHRCWLPSLVVENGVCESLHKSFFFLSLTETDHFCVYMSDNKWGKQVSISCAYQGKALWFVGWSSFEDQNNWSSFPHWESHLKTQFHGNCIFNMFCTTYLN